MRDAPGVGELRNQPCDFPSRKHGLEARVTSGGPFHGVAGVDVKAGLTALNYDEALIKRAMAESAAQVVAVAAAEKLGTAGPFAVVPIDLITHLVTDHTAPPEVLRPFREAGLTVITA